MAMGTISTIIPKKLDIILSNPDKAIKTHALIKAWPVVLSAVFWATKLVTVTLLLPDWARPQALTWATESLEDVNAV